jgi:ribonuclease PH
MPEATQRSRPDGRGPEEIRPLQIASPFLRHAEGSASIRTGHTWVVCAATVEDRQPGWLKGTSRGWVTAEYGMLPRAVGVRRGREATSRGLEIQRLVGRSLRAVVDLRLLPQHTITIDCDVIEADGGTRTAALTGAFVALCQACRWMAREGRIVKSPIRDQVAGLGIGIVGGQLISDLNYAEDSIADTDANLFMTAAGQVVGLSAAAEQKPFEAAMLMRMVEIARPGFERLFAAQRDALGMPAEGPFRPAELLR